VNVKIPKLKPKEWTEKFYEFLHYLFDEDDEVADDDVQEMPASESDHEDGSSYQWIWDLLAFLDLVNCIILLLPTLGYTSSHWTIYHVLNTRELHQHILGTALGILFVLFLLFMVFPKIMRVLLFSIVFLFGTLPLISSKYDYGSMWEKYCSHVRSLPIQLDNEIQGHVFYADEISDKLKKTVLKNVEHPNIQRYLNEKSISVSEMDLGTYSMSDYKSCIGLFQEVNDAWTYKPDPRKKDLYRSPHRTIHTLAGDCDDYTTLIASLFISQGYRMRIIMSAGHVYPELAIPNDHIYVTLMEPVIKTSLRYIADGSPPLYFHKDNEGTIWLNMDYTAAYPGGPFMDEKVLKVIYLD
jgi:hypothetical protein